MVFTSDLKYSQPAWMPTCTLSPQLRVSHRKEIPSQPKTLQQGNEYTQFQDLKFTLKALIKSNGQENLLYYENSRSWQAQ